MSRLKIHVTGRFSMTTSEGEDLTPRSAKECGLIALLIQSHDGVRTRGWLQAHLWSDRGPDQAASSLRQAVYRLKKLLGAFSEVIYSDRLCVGIRLGEIEVINDPEFEFLEGIDVRDDGFEGWLAAERAKFAASGAVGNASFAPRSDRLLPAQQVYIRFGIESGDPVAARWLGQLTSDLIARTLSETLDISVRHSAARAGAMGAWRIDVDVLAAGRRGHNIRLAIVEVATGRSLWAQNDYIDAKDGDAAQREEVIVLCQALVTAFSELYLDGQSNAELLGNAEALCHLGIAKLFSMQAEQVDHADRLFSDAFEIKERGLFLAWRAQVRQVQLLERIGSDRPALREEADAFARRAFEMEPNNSTVIGLLSANRLHFGKEVDTALDYARRAVKRNFCNAVAWWALSSAHINSDDHAKAYGSARIAVHLAQGTPLEFWALSQLSGAAIAIRKLSEAKGILKNVSFGRPDFRPPLRYLLAIHATNEEWDDAVAAVERLKQLEPDFSIDRFANDTDYPVRLLHRSIGLNRDRVLSLI